MQRIRELLPKLGLKSLGSKIWAAVSIGVAVLIGGQIMAGLLLGTLIVLVFVLTIEQACPFLWRLADNSWGRLVFAVGVGYLTHIVLGKSATIVALVAMTWSTVLKALILTFEGQYRKQQKEMTKKIVYAY